MPENNLSQFKYLKPAGKDQYSSACPKCGGVPHNNGEYPDRFRIFMHSKTTGDILGWCRQCGYVWVPRGRQLTEPQKKEWEQERKAMEARAKEKIESAIERLQRERAWERYHENLTANSRQYYYSRHISDYWIDYWMLGYNPEKTIWSNETKYLSPTLTIPVFDPQTQQVISLRNRILQPQVESDKYRPEFAGLPASLYFTDIEKPPKNKTLLLEGEFKAMTTYLVLDNPDIFVVGLPGKSPNLEMLEPLKDCDPVYILLDPDGYQVEQNGKVSAIRRMVDYFKSRARVMRLPFKVDDMIDKMGLAKEELQYLINHARRVV